MGERGRNMNNSPCLLLWPACGLWIGFQSHGCRTCAHYQECYIQPSSVTTDKALFDVAQGAK